MGIFNTSTPFDQIVEKVTDEKSKEDWGLIMEVCDRVGATTTGPKDCLRAIYKRLQHQDPHVVLQALTLLDACVNNCGQYFLLEVASRDFETEFRKVLVKVHPKVQEKMKSLLKSWANGEFSKDPKYSLIPSLYSNLKREGHSFGGEECKEVRREVPKDPNVVQSQQEEDDIAKAIQLSLQENSKQKGTLPAASSAVLYPMNSLYSSGGSTSPSNSVVSSSSSRPEKKARCLYDFEAAEDNELTFKAGEVLVILDDEDPNWWKGSNHRGEGLFPANFVTLSLEPEPGERRKSVQFNEEVEVKTVEKLDFTPQLTVDEDKIDQLLSILHEADPLEETDPPFLPQLEDQVASMCPLIDAELERIDRQHARLTRLSHELVDALSLYHTLMREMPSMQYPPYSMSSFMSGMPPASIPISSNPVGMPAYSMQSVNNMSGTPGPAGQVYYMDSNMSAQRYHGSAPPPTPPVGYPGSAPPPTPPLQDPNMMAQNPDHAPQILYSSPQMIYSTPQ